MPAIGRPCDRCHEDNWHDVIKPFERPECLGCGFLPVTTMPGSQTDFVLSTAAHPALLGGRGSSKTVGGLLKMWTYVHAHPGANGAISFPVYNDIETIFLPEMRKFFGELEGSGWVYLEKKKQLVFPTLNSRAFLISAEEPDRGRGLNIAWFWMEEVGIGSGHKHLFFNLQPALRQFGDDYGAYQGWITSTPKVDRPWLKQIWDEGVHPITGEPIEDRHEYPIFPMRTVDNANLPRSIRERLVKEWANSRMAQQELEGKFISVEGVVYPELSEDIHLRDPHMDIEFIATVVGLDFGDASPTAMVELKQDRSRKVWLTREFYKRQATDEDWLTCLAEWNAPLVLCDPSASEKDLMGWRKKYGINIKPAISARGFKERGRLWRNRIALHEGTPNIYISPGAQNTWNEMINLAHYVRKGEEDPQDKFAPGTNDHAYDAGAYGLSYFDRGFIGRPQQPFKLGRLVHR